MSERTAHTAALAAVPELEAGRRVALRVAWSAFCGSRTVVWAAGMAAVLVFGTFPDISARLDPFWFTAPFDSSANLLVAPGARWDSAWYLAIARFGYGADAGRAAFFPLYPALLALGGSVVGSELLFGILLSSACGVGALYLLHRLVALDFDPQRTRTTVLMLAWFPSAIFLSAVYTEALFLLVSIGAIYAARLGRWPAAGLLGMAAASTRSAGVLILLPLLALYLYGPRADRPGRVAPGRPRRPAHPLRRDVLWLAAIPLGLLLYVAYLGIATGAPLAPFTAQSQWSRIPVGPVGGVALGAWSAVRGAWDLLLGTGPGPAALRHGADPHVLAVRDIVLFGFLVLAAWLTREVFRRLPLAYGVHVVSGLVLPLSVPARGHALMSLPRFMLVLFPLWIALALWAHERGRVRAVLVVMGALLAVWSGLFTTWVWAP